MDFTTAPKVYNTHGFGILLSYKRELNNLHPTSHPTSSLAICPDDTVILVKFKLSFNAFFGRSLSRLCKLEYSKKSQVFLQVIPSGSGLTG